MISRYILLTVVLLTMVSCEVSPKPINYGSDGCHFCSMTIVDKQHAAEIVTKKGKAFKFDAVECMMNHLKDVDITTIELFLVNDFHAPGTLIDAKDATFLISKSIPSPMGEYLSAFYSKEQAELVEAENEGELYTWDGLKSRFKVN
ncbi:nitrous oxide reductase accessory protein NosL [Maribacter polysiphoniae]|uniref:Copper chaperone NosL n=1 Tax=Maribacter polysiphoniae TaxID=429344 RepID=A0A316E351_9FLAO|nr:nitrous oxide reductase accessory protein NosL [Maribacter polysiphoniae]MBD1259725.1 nitrous oxide reductase accessory protein NosL [Maribacter polysiphoniae]PWK23133.1 copper chaperone NosL [Maribacter polysiphoniae]